MTGIQSGLLHSKFKFTQLNYDVYARFFELFSLLSIGYKSLISFMLTNKKNYIRCIKIYGMYVYISDRNADETLSFALPNRIFVGWECKDQFLTFLNEYPKFTPYMRRIRLAIDAECNDSFNFLPEPLQYTECFFSELYSKADIDKLKRLYYHKEVKRLMCFFDLTFSSSNVVELMNYIIERMPNKSYEFKITGSLEDFKQNCKSIVVPQNIENIKVEVYDPESRPKQTDYYYKNKRWVRV